MLGDRIDPRKLVFMGLGATAVCNVAFPFVSSVPVLIVLWTVNGFAQAMFWPPLVKLMSVYFKGDGYTRASTNVSLAAQIALLAVFGLSALFIRLSAWRAIFFLATALALLTALVLFLGFRVLERRYPGAVSATMGDRRSVKVEATAPRPALWSIVIASGLLFVFSMTMLLGFLRDGLEEWLSTYLCDTFSLAADFSTLLNIAMPLFCIVCVKMTRFLYERIFHDEIREVAAVTLVSLAALVLLVLIGSSALWVAVLLLMLSVAGVHMANVCLTGYLPARFGRTGRVSTVAGLVNAFTYVGSTVATSAMPLLFGRFSWTTALLTCAVVAFLCLLCAVLMMRRWQRWNES